jgi:hypothetical protein
VDAEFVLTFAEPAPQADSRTPARIPHPPSEPHTPAV